MEIGPLSARILRELCTNSRVSLSELERKIKTPPYALSRRIKRLEEELGLLYTLEIDQTKLGLSKMNVLNFKFSKKPSKEVIKSVIEKSDMVQLALATKGDMDLVMFIAPRNTEEYAKWELSLFLKFSKYGIAPSPSYADIIHLGFVPLNEWAINSSSLKDVYKKILIALNRDSRQTIRDLGKNVGLDEDLARYYLIKLQKEGIIKRFTTIVTKPPLRANILLFVNYIFREGFVKRVLDKRRRVYFKNEDQLPMCNEYQMVASLSGAEYDLVWGTYKSEKDAVENCIHVHRSVFEKDSPSIRYCYIQDVVKGSMPIRSISIKDNYVATAWVEE